MPFLPLLRQSFITPLILHSFVTTSWSSVFAYSWLSDIRACVYVCMCVYRIELVGRRRRWRGAKRFHFVLELPPYRVTNPKLVRNRGELDRSLSRSVRYLPQSLWNPLCLPSSFYDAIPLRLFSIIVAALSFAALLKWTHYKWWSPQPFRYHFPSLSSTFRHFRYSRPISH